MKIIGHRGLVTFSPENSLISLDYFKKFKYKWIETDVILTKDNIPIIFHDKKLDRITNLKGEVKKYTYEDLKSADIGYKFSKKFINEKIPLLEEYINKCNELSINIFLELKSYYHTDKILIKKVLDIINKYKNIEIIICSYSRKIIKYLKNKYEKISLIVDEIPEDYINFVKTNNCYSLNIKYNKNNLENIKECKKNIKTYCHVINDYEDYEKLKKLNIDGIITDKIEYFIESYI